ncbi:MAG: hypothetical protein JWP42_4349 [Pseudomonas sp.]|nr:hypothetical protein [Pseudomonas sp.]
MKGLIALVVLILSLATLIASAWHSGDTRRHWRTAAFLLAICFAFSLVWAVWP